MKLFKYLSSSPRSGRTLGSLQPSKGTRVRSPTGSVKAAKRQKAASKELADVLSAWPTTPKETSDA